MRTNIFILFPFFLSSVLLTKAQINSNSEQNAKNKVFELINFLKKNKLPLYTNFDSVTTIRITKDCKKIREKFYSQKLLSYKFSKEEAFMDSITQSVLLYNNNQYLNKISYSLISLRLATGKQYDKGKGIPRNELFSDYLCTLILSLKKDGEEVDVYHILMNTSNKIITISPLLQFGEDSTTPKINRLINSLVKWQDTARTVYHLDRTRQ